MTVTGFGAICHVPHALCAEAVGEDGSVLVTLGDDAAAVWALVAAVSAHQNLIVTLGPSALRDLGLACIEAAGRIEQRGVILGKQT